VKRKWRIVLQNWFISSARRLYRGGQQHREDQAKYRLHGGIGAFCRENGMIIGALAAACRMAKLAETRATFSTARVIRTSLNDVNDVSGGMAFGATWVGRVSISDPSDGMVGDVCLDRDELRLSSHGICFINCNIVPATCGPSTVLLPGSHGLSLCCTMRSLHTGFPRHFSADAVFHAVPSYLVLFLFFRLVLAVCVLAWF